MARRDDDVISRLAGELRVHLNLPHTMYIDIPTVFWKFRKLRKDFNFAIIPDAELPDAEATWDSYKRRLSIRQSLYCDINRHIPHARMVAAEEIAHAYLDHHGIRNHSVQAKAYEKSHARTRNEEREARIFAANFLAPYELIQSNFTVDDISFKFGLSAKAAHIRYEEHQRWQSLRNNKPRDLPEKVSDFLKEAKMRGYQIKSV